MSLPTSQNDPDCYLIARFRIYTTLDMDHFRQLSDTEKMHREVVTSSCHSPAPKMLTSLETSKLMSPLSQVTISLLRSGVPLPKWLTERIVISPIGQSECQMGQRSTSFAADVGPGI